jgi:hypothetical protein
VWRVLLRVVLTLIPLVSIGVLSWVPLLRLALLRRRARDWVGCAVVAVLSTGGFVLGGYTDDENDWQTNTGVSTILVLAVVTPVYFLIADLRRQDAVRLTAPRETIWPPRQDAPPPFHQPVHHWPTPHPAPQPFAPQPSAAQPFAPQSFAAPPVPPSPIASALAGNRIDQVRAELDELSAYLRAQDEGDR